MRRTMGDDSEIDPMNATTRTVFFDKTKSSKISSSHYVPKTLEKFTDPTTSNKKLNSLKKEIDNVQKSHIEVKQRLELKSKLVKNAKIVLDQTQGKLNDVLKNTSQEFEQNKLELIGEMSSKMAHDLKNPLNVLHAHVQLMKIKQEKEEDEMMTHSLIKMENAISNITEQINDVMNFIRKPDMKFSSCDLKVLLTKTVEGVQLPEDVELELSVNSCIIKCDIIKIKGIITNILQNSIQAIKSKGKINLTVTDSDNRVEINIVDSGPGIAEENIEKVFEPLFTTKPLGNGLGLASCKELVEKHEGTISVKNNPTTFTIMLPKTSS